MEVWLLMYYHNYGETPEVIGVYDNYNLADANAQEIASRCGGKTSIEPLTLNYTYSWFVRG